MEHKKPNSIPCQEFSEGKWANGLAVVGLPPFLRKVHLARVLTV